MSHFVINLISKDYKLSLIFFSDFCFVLYYERIFTSQYFRKAAFLGIAFP